MSNSACGECTLCCKVTEVHELSKPINKDCLYCEVGSGCSKYSDRPLSCRNFSCFWLRNSDLSKEMRPDKCGVVIEVLSSSTFLFLVDPERPNSWKSLEVSEMAAELVKSGISLVIHLPEGNKVWLSEGKTREDVWKDIKRVLYANMGMKWQHRPIQQTLL